MDFPVDKPMEPDMMTDRCPTCGSPRPHLHPAMQFEGEVETCPDLAAGSVPVATPPANVTRSAGDLIREIAQADPEAHNRALALGYGVVPVATPPDRACIDCGFSPVAGARCVDCGPDVGPVATPTEPAIERVPLTELITEWELLRCGSGMAGLGLNEQRWLLAELRAARAELAVLRPSLRRAKGRIDKALARIDKAEPRQWRRVAVMDDIRAALTGPVETPRTGPEVTHPDAFHLQLTPENREDYIVRSAQA